MTARPVALAWSGGKDSALALRALRREGTTVAALLTTFTDDYDRVSMHGVRRALVRDQAAAAGIPLVEVGIPAGCLDEVYAARMEAAFRSPPLTELDAVASGDLFLEDVRAYREERLASAGKSGLLPALGTRHGRARALVHRRRLRGVRRLRRPRHPRRVVRRPQVRRRPARRPAAGDRPLRRERRVPLVCLRRTVLRPSRPVSGRRAGASRRLCVRRPRRRVAAGPSAAVRRRR